MRRLSVVAVVPTFPCVDTSDRRRSFSAMCFVCNYHLRPLSRQSLCLTSLSPRYSSLVESPTISDLTQDVFKYTTSGFGVSDINLYTGNFSINSNLLPYSHPGIRVPWPQEDSSPSLWSSCVSLFSFRRTPVSSETFGVSLRSPLGFGRLCN